MEKLLTKKKRAWASRRKPEMLKASPFTPPAGVRAAYYASLEAMIDQMIDETEREIRKLFESEHAEEFFTQDASTASQARIVTNALIKKFNGLFTLRGKNIADRFAKRSDKASSAQVHSTLKELSGGLSLGTRVLDQDTRQIMTAIIAENVGLIKTIPQKYLMGVQGAVMRSITSGQGVKDLIPYMQKHKGITYRRARFIASDQTNKANAALTRGRLEKLKFPTWRWVHTGGGAHPRKLHQELNGKVFRFDEPPPIIQYAKKGQPQVRGYPGDLPGCRCKQQAVLVFEET